MKSDGKPAIVPRIFAFRGESVMLDCDLAGIYGLETKVFNQALKGDTHRFPSDFAFQLQREELAILKSQIVTSSSPGGRRKLPWVFTDYLIRVIFAEPESGPVFLGNSCHFGLGLFVPVVE